MRDIKFRAWDSKKKEWLHSYKKMGGFSLFGETIVIGGLVKETTSKQVEKIWLLGDIPILGYLFQNAVTKTEKTDLLIFITPKIVGYQGATGR